MTELGIADMIRMAEEMTQSLLDPKKSKQALDKCAEILSSIEEDDPRKTEKLVATSVVCSLTALLTVNRKSKG